MKITRNDLRRLIREALVQEDRTGFNQALIAKAEEIGWSSGEKSISDADEWVDMKKHSRLIKDLFRQHADREFLNSLVTIHWKDPASLIGVVNASSKDEFSVSAYLPGQITKGPFGNTGLVMKGHISLLANSMDFLYTRGGRAYTKAHPERTKQSGANKGITMIKPVEEYTKQSNLGLVVDASDWSPSSSLTGKSWNEALLDNWKPVAFIDATPTNKMVRWAAGVMGGGDKLTNELQAVAQEAGMKYLTLAEANKMTVADWQSFK